jgi:hypothetical protein
MFDIIDKSMELHATAPNPRGIPYGEAAEAICAELNAGLTFEDAEPKVLEVWRHYYPFESEQERAGFCAFYKAHHIHASV